MVSRAMSMNGLFVLQDFDIKQVAKRKSNKLRNEFLCLSYLKWKMVLKYMGQGTKLKTQDKSWQVCRGMDMPGLRSGNGKAEVHQTKRSRKMRECRGRSWALPLAGPLNKREVRDWKESVDYVR